MRIEAGSGLQVNSQSEVVGRCRLTSTVKVKVGAGDISQGRGSCRAVVLVCTKDEALHSAQKGCESLRQAVYLTC